MKDLKKILKNEESFDKEFNYQYNELKRVIDNPIEFRSTIKVKLKDSIAVIPFITYIVNLMMWKPMITLKQVPSSEEIFNTNNITGPCIKEYIDRVYTRPYRTSVDIKELSIKEIEIIENTKKIVEDFGIILGITYNLYQILEECKRQPKLKDILYTKIPDGLQPNEIEEFGKSRLKELVDILVHSKTGFKPLIESGAGVKLGQLQELMAIIGNKPDLDGTTFSVPINTNILAGGLSKPSDYVLDSSAGMKALIMNKKYTGHKAI